MNTVKIMPNLATALLHFPTLDAATKALPALVKSGVTVTELMDSSSLQLCRDDPVNGHIIRQLPGAEMPLFSSSTTAQIENHEMRLSQLATPSPPNWICQ